MMDHYDWVIVGSGFGGSVSALRLVEKGYRVLLVEKGRRYTPQDFPRSSLDLRNFLWRPEVGLRGPFQMSFFRHLTVYSGVGVGGGSLVYANTLPIPQQDFFEQGSWAGLADWQAELQPHYGTARRMLGATENPRFTAPDHALKAVAKAIGREEHFGPTQVAVHFGEQPGREVPDPYFDGEGPARRGCTFCGGCMTGCRVGAKNTLDKNYLYLAEKKGLTLLAETTADVVQAHDGGYRLELVNTFGLRRRRRTVTADRVVLSGGVLGTVDLLLRMREEGHLPELSDEVGRQVRTNSEALIGVTTRRKDLDLSEGIAISSILHTDEHSHLEPVRYAAGTGGLFRAMVLPHAPGSTLIQRLAASARTLLANPRHAASAALVGDWAKATTILLYMRTLEGTMAFERGRMGLRSNVTDGASPAAFIPEATALADRMAKELDGFTVSMFMETLLGTPSTAHVLGGACIGATPHEGVIGPDHQVHGHPGLYVCDGSAVSANPGVNPSLTITAMSERAMAGIA